MSDARAYPRPQLQRAEWVSLDGRWDFALDREGAWTEPGDVTWSGSINVPFSPETRASGVGDTTYYQACWYRRRLSVPALAPGERLILHFGAVDYLATVWINGRVATRHHGGYTPFAADITDLAMQSAATWIVVRAEDDPIDLAKPRGKQDWFLEPHSIWYPRTTGIWQTVWLERLPATALCSVRWTPNLERWEVGIEARLDGVRREDLRLHVRLHIGSLVLADDTYAVLNGEVSRRIAFSDPGIDDYRNELLWSPQSPTLIRAELELLDPAGLAVDRVASYTALRSIGIQGHNVVLNGRPYLLRLVLDQGYWPDTGLTAPDDDALRRDIELVRAMGFNGVRKHQKVEDPRFLHLADQLGLLVWEEMPSAYRFTASSIERLTREWIDVIQRDYSHPCIVAWVPFNESWGVPNLPEIQAQRHFVQGLYHLTKTLDPTRPVVGNDGWESVATDIVGIHDYDANPARVAERYESADDVPHMFKRERPGGRLLTLEGHQHAGQPIMLTEFGGIAYSTDPDTWGYSIARTPEELQRCYCALLEVVRNLPLLAGFCYTQLTDTYQEANGLLFFDRRPKFPIEQVALATRGPILPHEARAEKEWHERMSRFHRQVGAEVP